MKDTPPNRLIYAASPYLLQHAYNPVDWYPWGSEALQKAKSEDKPILVSIGYSACHWCHVMERECFENEELATLMNRFFICIKVDREERPDVDAIYMEALQAMGQNGGWPLNVFLTPDQKPFYGGTYFPPATWRQVVTQLSKTFREKRQEVEDSANQLTQMLQVSELQKYLTGKKPATPTLADLSAMAGKISERFDGLHGGTQRAPKFPMPSIWRFLLRVHHLGAHSQALGMVRLTLQKMAGGGIYDQLGGGFARYSVDAEWKAPHFEKMLYDNGQLLGLYAEAYQLSPDPRTREVLEQTIGWAQREMQHPQGGFFAALDADSEGVEGKYYCWTKEEWQQALGEEPLLWEFWQMKDEGNWEHGLNILFTNTSDEEFATSKGLALEEWKTQKENVIAQLMQVREHRIRPGLDHKILAGWNGMLIRGLADTGRALGNSQFVEIAKKAAGFVASEMTQSSQGAPTLLHRCWQAGSTSLYGTLEDYAFVTDGYLALYEATLEPRWYHQARQLTQLVLDHFSDPDEQMFFYTDARSEALIARKKELFDNVIPSTNAVMARNLMVLGKLGYEDSLMEKGMQMLERMTILMQEEPAYLSHWGLLAAEHLTGMAEVVLVGDKAHDMAMELAGKFLPGTILALAGGTDAPPMTQGKQPINGQTTLYVCYNKACRQPVHSVEEAMRELREY